MGASGSGYALYLYGAGQRRGCQDDLAQRQPGGRVGSGSQEIVAVDPGGRVEVALDFGTQGNGIAYYQLDQSGSGTRVTWGFDTDFGNDLAGRYFGLLFDRFIGPDYERGLSNLKTLTESGAAP